jgi:hypothetical protein
MKTGTTSSYCRVRWHHQRRQQQTLSQREVEILGWVHVSRRTSAGFVLSNVRTALLTAPFRDACQMSDFNADQRAFFQEAFYSNRGDAELLSQDERETRNNPSGLQSYLKKTLKK